MRELDACTFDAIRADHEKEKERESHSPAYFSNHTVYQANFQHPGAYLFQTFWPVMNVPWSLENDMIARWVGIVDKHRARLIALETFRQLDRADTLITDLAQLAASYIDPTTPHDYNKQTKNSAMLGGKISDGDARRLKFQDVCLVHKKKSASPFSQVHSHHGSPPLWLLPPPPSPHPSPPSFSAR